MKRRVAVAVAVLCSVGACGRRAKAPARDKAAPTQEQQESGRLASLGYAAPGQAVPPATMASAPAPPAALQAMVAARKLIRTGQMTLEVKSFAAAAAEARRLVEAAGGYLADSRVTRSDEGKERGTLSLRIPADRFEETLAAVRRLGTVKAESVSAQDITKAYADLETRLRVKRETLDRLRAILRTQTGKLAEVLEAEREIARVTGEIETAEGERRFYDQQVALSTLSLELAEPEPMLTGGAFDPIREALGDGLEVLSTSIAAMLYFFFGATPWFLLIWILFVLFRRIRARRKATPPTPPQTAS